MFNEKQIYIYYGNILMKTKRKFYAEHFRPLKRTAKTIILGNANSSHAERLGGDKLTRRSAQIFGSLTTNKMHIAKVTNLLVTNK